MTAVRGTRTGLVLFLVALVVGCWATIEAEVTADAVTPCVVTAVIAIIVGEQMPTAMAGRVVAPVTTAAATGLVMAPPAEALPRPATIGVIWLAMLAGVLIARMRGRLIFESALGARFLGIATTALFARGISDPSLVQWAFTDGTRRALAVLALFAVALTGSVVERLLEGTIVWLRQRGTTDSIEGPDTSSILGIIGVTASAGPLIAMAQPVLDWVSYPLLLLPVLLTHMVVQRAVAIRLTLDESVHALSRLTEAAGRSPDGHGARVAALSVRIGRVMGLDVDDLREVERTALLHDVGLVGLDEPIPNGATINASTQVQDRAADSGTRIVASSPQLRPIAVMLDQVRTPFRRSREFGEFIPVAARIVRVANAWDDITEGTRTERAHQVALERLHLGLGYDYDPEVVTALERTLG